MLQRGVTDGALLIESANAAPHGMEKWRTPTDSEGQFPSLILVPKRRERAIISDLCYRGGRGARVGSVIPIYCRQYEVPPKDFIFFVPGNGGRQHVCRRNLGYHAGLAWELISDGRHREL